MSVFKSGKNYVVEFMWNGERFRKSTFQGDRQAALVIEKKWKADLAKGGAGIGERKAAITLAAFIENQFEPWIKNLKEKTAPKSWHDWYKPNLNAIKAFDPTDSPFASKPIDELTSEDTARFSAFRNNGDLAVSSVNSTLRVLRRVLKVAGEWGVRPVIPKGFVQLLRGEKGRDRVITPLEQAKYLAAAPERLAHVATIMFDTGFRPDEVFRLKWENIRWGMWKNGGLYNDFGKTKAAKRTLPASARVAAILRKRHKAAGEPAEGFVFPAETKSGHIESSSIRKLHKATFAAINEFATKHKETKVKPFVLYSIRHTFLTNLGTSRGPQGQTCDVYTLAKIAGHSSIVMSMRYVHPSEESMANIFLAVGYPEISPE